MASSEPETETRPGFRILIVDDEPFSRHMVSRQFQSLGAADVVFAASAAEARAAMAADSSVRMIVSDHYMPEENGIRLLADLRQGRLPVPHDTYFVVSTSSTSFALAAVALAMDADSFISKPYAREELARRLYAFLKGSERAIKPAAHYQGVDVDGMLRAAESLDPIAARPVGAAPPRKPLARVLPDTPLVDDLVGPDGHVLLPTGTVLTRQLIGRLTELGVTEVPVARTAADDAADARRQGGRGAEPAR